LFKKLLLLNFDDDTFENGYWERLRKASESVVLLSEDDPQVAAELATADGLLLRLGMGADRARIDEAPNLRYVGMLGTGYGRIDVAYARAKEITVSNVADYSTQGVAEFVFAVLLSHLRELERARAQAAAGDYSEATFTGSEIGSKTFGVVGLGNIGRRVAEIASDGFGANTVYWSRSPKDLGDRSAIRRVELPDLLRTADVISLHLEHNPETDGILDREAIMSIRAGAIVVNTAPMELLDLDALDERLSAGDITFILDHSDELSAADADRLSAHPNCVVYPPIAYTTVESTAAKQEVFVRNIESFLAGSPTNKVN
jgi:glycerate dehydrogenase